MRLSANDLPAMRGAVVLVGIDGKPERACRAIGV